MLGETLTDDLTFWAIPGARNAVGFVPPQSAAKCLFSLPPSSIRISIFYLIIGVVSFKTMHVKDASATRGFYIVLSRCVISISLGDSFFDSLFQIVRSQHSKEVTRTYDNIRRIFPFDISREILRGKWRRSFPGATGIVTIYSSGPARIV